MSFSFSKLLLGGGVGDVNYTGSGTKTLLKSKVMVGDNRPTAELIIQGCSY